MSIVKRKLDGSFEIVSGNMRLKAMLKANGKAQVIDMKSNKTLFVHEVGGQLVAITEDAQASIDDLTQATINRARG